MPAISPRELVTSVVKMASLPGVYFEVKRLIDDPTTALGDLERTISADPVLTMQLLRIANSAFYGFAAKVETVSRAVNLLGFQQVHDMALAVSMASAFRGISPQLMDMRQFWYASVYCGVTARVIAAHCDVLDSERLFVEGLLADIGHLVMYEQIPAESQQALHKSQQSGLPLHQVEQELLGCDYAQIGAMLMQEWNLPQSLQESVRWQTSPASAKDFALEVCILHIAGQVTRAALAGQPVEEWALHIDTLAWRVTGLSRKSLADIKQEADANAGEIVELFFPSRRGARKRQEHYGG